MPPTNHPAVSSQDEIDLDEDFDASHPDLRLRIVRTATGSLHEAINEDERRRIFKRRKGTFKKRTLFGTLKRRPDTADSKESKASRKKSLAGDNAEDPSIPRPPTALGLEEQTAKAEKFAGPEATGFLGIGKRRAAESRRRRNIYVNMSLRPEEADARGEPLARWARNKVRTTKYTLWSFVPKNLTEQFKRVANIYFLALVVLQVFPIFGAAAPQVAMLPLVVILLATGVKDGIEDYRRNTLDNEVNNSAVTRLTGWRNVNQPADARSFFERIFGMADPKTKISKGVRKLRAKEGSFDAHYLANQSDLSLSKGAESLDMSKAESNDGYTLKSFDGGYSVPMRGRSLTNASKSTLAPSTIAPPYRQGGHSGVVDYSRHAPGTAQWERTLWKKLEVGDIVLLREDEQVPADIVVLSSSDPDGNCFVETKNLDGETNLKPRKSLRATMSIQMEEDVEHAQFVIDSEPPHANLYSYNAVMHYKNQDASGLKQVDQMEPVTINELLLRGCALRNTAWVIGLVVFTGPDTKIMLNQGETPSKRSKIEKETNFNVLSNFVILVAMCLACGVASAVYTSRDSSQDYYEIGAEVSGSLIIEAVVTFASCLILFQNIVPISLVISIEVVKTIQALFIFNDLDMYYQPLDHPCVPKTWNISDDLGQIEYIFSDKTGTLTQNVMEFKKCSVQGIPYGDGITEANKGAAKREGNASALNPAQSEHQLEEQKQVMIAHFNRQFKNDYLQPDKLTLISTKFAEDLADTSQQQRQHIVDFFKALALCHTVLADRGDGKDSNTINYKAESPDEAALVSAARDVGFTFLDRKSNEVTIEVMGQIEKWTPLRVLEFNSTRKRMSVIMRSTDDRLVLICKGADSIIYQRLKADVDQALKTKTSQDLEDFANGGLRTLCIASRELSEEEYAEWVKSYDIACASTVDREEEIEKTCEVIERDLNLLGATALEDKLQAGVPEAIEALHQAGIKLWILTGDKLQTAIEIGFSCNLLKHDMDIMIISSDSEAGARAQIDAALKQVADAIEKSKSTELKQEHAVVIDGETLRYALSDSLKPSFLALSTQCETVVCCRVSPAQKAQTVKLVKDGMKAMTLAIGDGANDVAMIQEAHIGVGIAGLEGAQASMSADYAVGQFRFLTKLLLVHGRWCYKRVAIFHEVFFYKNCIWTFPMFWYQIYCNFNATYLFDYSYIMLYATIFTCIPVLVLGILDQDVNAKASLANPALYKRGIQGLEYTKTLFWAFILDGLYQSLICFYVPYFVWGFSTTMSKEGWDANNLVNMGTTIAISAVFAANAYTGLVTQYWTILATVFLVFSALSGLIWTGVYSIFPYQLHGIFPIVVATPSFWLSFALIQVLCLSPRYLYDFLQKTYFPADVDIIRERVVYGMSDPSAPTSIYEDFNFGDMSTKSGSKTDLAPPQWASSSANISTITVSEDHPLRQRQPSSNDEIHMINMQETTHPSKRLSVVPEQQQQFGVALSREPSNASLAHSVADSFATARSSDKEEDPPHR